MVARNPIVALLLTKPARRRATNVACACVCVGAAGHCPLKGLAPFANLNEMRKKKTKFILSTTRFFSMTHLAAAEMEVMARNNVRIEMGATVGR